MIETYIIDPMGKPAYDFTGTPEEAVRHCLKHVYATPQMCQKLAALLLQEGFVQMTYGYYYTFISTKDGARQKPALYLEN